MSHRRLKKSTWRVRFAPRAFLRVGHEPKTPPLSNEGQQLLPGGNVSDHGDETIISFNPHAHGPTDRSTS